jgi:hypothetical protein
LLQANLLKAFKRLLQKRLPCTKDINELFGVGCFADRPESGTDSTGHNDTEIMFVHASKMFLGIGK